MTIRYDRNRRSTVNLTGGPYVTFPADVVEIDLDDPERERRIAEHYDGVELIEDDAEAEAEADADLCGAIKTNGEPCDRLAEECRWHSQDEDDEADADAEDEGVEADADADEADAEADADAEAEDVEECGAEMLDGSICDRPADECRFHSADEDEAEADADAEDAADDN